jgi:F0F1-type ATP synthase assembly protein I
MADPGDPERRERGLSGLAEGYQKAAPYLGASTSLVGSVLAFSLGGYWLDKKVGTGKPWFFIAGALIGMVGGFISFFHTVLGLPGRKGGQPPETRRRGGKGLHR